MPGSSPGMTEYDAALMRNRAGNFSIGRLMEFLTALGQDVRITVNEAARLPGDFPADIALPSTYTVVRVERSGNGTTVVIATPGTVDEEAARLRSAMPARGWAPGHVLQPRTGVAQAWVKDDRAVLAWLTPGEAGGVRVQLQLVPR